MRFFDGFRARVHGYSDGVHELGAPASGRAIEACERALGRSLHPDLRDFLGSFDGCRLFHDTYELYPAERLALEDDGIIVGEGPEGRLLLGDDGRVYRIDDDGAALVAGASLEAFLDAILAREAVLVDAGGEFRDVFEEDESGATLKLAARRRRGRAAEAADPRSALWRLEAAELALEQGDRDEAVGELEVALEIDPGAPEVAVMLARLHEEAARSGQPERAARASEILEQAAARLEGSAAARVLASAACTARLAGDAARADSLAARARELDGQLSAALLGRAQLAWDAGRAEEARELAELADVIASTPETRRLLGLARARNLLRPS